LGKHNEDIGHDTVPLRSMVQEKHSYRDSCPSQSKSCKHGWDGGGHSLGEHQRGQRAEELFHLAEGWFYQRAAVNFIHHPNSSSLQDNADDWQLYLHCRGILLNEACNKATELSGGGNCSVVRVLVLTLTQDESLS